MSKHIGIGMNIWKNIGIGLEWSRYRYRLLSAYIGMIGEIDDMQDYIEISDSEGEEDEQLNYSIKVENKSFTDNIEEESDLPEIQGCIEFSDSDNED